MHKKNKNRVSIGLKLSTHASFQCHLNMFYSSCTAGFSGAVRGGNWLAPLPSAKVSRTFTAK